MSDVIIRAVMPYISGLPEDVAINDWAVTSPTGVDVTGSIETFYNSPVPGGDAVADFLSSIISREDDACRFEVYLIPDTEGPLGAPVLVVPWTLEAPASNDGLPQEVALCTSFAAGGTAPPGRRKGRVYLGPLSTAALSGSGQSRPSTNFMATVLASTERLHDDLIVYDATLNVFSRADWESRPTIRGWVDNAWDTQRRRGLEATARTTWPTAPTP